jgi:Na+:H+ antiporter, NhaA family
VFLTALAIIDDLGAVIIIALCYTGDMNLWALGGAAVTAGILTVLNRMRIGNLLPYLALGMVLWLLVFMSGVHATIAGVVVALTIPLTATPGRPEDRVNSPLHRLEHGLHRPVSFVIVPIFGFANAGVSLAGVSLASFAEPITIGVALGLVAGKLIGVFGSVVLMVRLGLAPLPGAASWGQTFGVALFCGIGFTMSLFVALLAFNDPHAQDQAKIGIPAGSVVAGALGYIVLSIADRQRAK